MRKLLFIVPNLSFNGTTTQVSHLINGLPKRGYQVCMISLRNNDSLPFSRRFPGVQYESLTKSNHWDLGALWKLQQLVKSFQPDLIHAWGTASLRSLALALGKKPCPVLVSQPLTPNLKGFSVSWWDRLLLQWMDALVVSGNAEADWCRRLGLNTEKTIVVAPGVPHPRSHHPRSQAPAWERGLPAGDNNAENVVCIGPLATGKGYYEAIWLYDVLRRLKTRMRLSIAGDGPALPRLKKFAKELRLDKMIHFTGPCADVQTILQDATVVWSLAAMERGKNVLLEALALGKPVVASALPGFAEIVADGKMGYLVSPGDKFAVVKKTRILFDDPDLRGQMGQAALAHVRDHFSCQRLHESYSQIYEKLAA